MIDTIVGIFAPTHEEIERKVRLVAGSVDWVQIDVSDGTLVPTKTSLDFEALSRLVAEHPDMRFEAHLMVANPEKYIRSLVDAGFTRLIAAVESDDPRLFLDQAKYESVEVGLAIDGSTELEIIEPFCEEVDTVLVMMADPGSDTREAGTEHLEKVRAIRQHYPDLPIEVEECVSPQTMHILEEAGATRAVATSFIFADEASVKASVERLKNS